jgi:hypothetical protein
LFGTFTALYVALLLWFSSATYWPLWRARHGGAILLERRIERSAIFIGCIKRRAESSSLAGATNALAQYVFSRLDRAFDRADRRAVLLLAALERRRSLPAMPKLT